MVQLNVLWQVPQSRAVIGCCADLLSAVTPLWHAWQLDVTPT